MASSGQGWKDELQSFLPHALDCVDPNCLRPLCVNLKLTLRHVQLCEKSDQCTICQGMKSLAVTHSNSCRDYYCRVPFCMEAKVTTQQQILIDELVKTSPDGQKDSNLHVKEADKKCGSEDLSRKAVNSCPMPVTGQTTTSGELTKMSGEECAEKVPHSDPDVDVVWTVAQNSPLGSQNTSQVPISIGKTFLPEWTEPSHFQPATVGSPKRFQPRTHKAESPSHGGLSSDSERPIPSSKTTADPPKTNCKPGTKRKLQNFISTNMSMPASKMYRSASDGKGAQNDDCPEFEIVLRKSSESFKMNDAAAIKDNTIVHKRSSSNVELSTKQKRENPTPLHPAQSIKRNPSLKTTFKPPTKETAKATNWDATYDSSGMGFLPVYDGAADQITDDSADCYIEEIFSTPPPSPTFEMWFGDTVKTNDSLLKSVLLDTLFQLLGIVTQPKTKHQEAIFVDLLERTLRIMKTEIAKQ